MWLTILRQPALSSSAHMIYNRTQDIRMTESNLHWLAFGWRNMSVVDFYSISLICVSFSSYLYEGKHSLRSSWIHPLLKLAKVLLSRCQMVEDELSLGGLLLDSMTGPFPPHFSLFHCILQCLTTTKWFRSSDLLILLCHLVDYGSSSSSSSAVCAFIPHLYLFSIFILKGWWGGGLQWVSCR